MKAGQSVSARGRAGVVVGITLAGASMSKWGPYGVFSARGLLRSLAYLRQRWAATLPRNRETDRHTQASGADHPRRTSGGDEPHRSPCYSIRGQDHVPHYDPAPRVVALVFNALAPCPGQGAAEGAAQRRQIRAHRTLQRQRLRGLGRPQGTLVDSKWRDRW